MNAARVMQDAELAARVWCSTECEHERTIALMDEMVPGLAHRLLCAVTAARAAGLIEDES